MTSQFVIGMLEVASHFANEFKQKEMMLMDIHSIGQNIKFHRTLKGLTQNELAEGICTQAQISNIEAGKFIPLSTTLYELSKKLGIDMKQFFIEATNPRYDYVQDFITEVRRLTVARKYDEVYQLILAEESKPIFDNIELKQFILWHKGFSSAFVLKNYSNSLALLKQSLELTQRGKNNYSQEEVQILNAMGIVYDISGSPVASIKYYEIALSAFQYNPSINPQIKIRILYNYSKAQTTLHNLAEAISLCSTGIDICLKNEVLYLLGECTYQKGYCSILLGEKDEGVKHIEDAIFLFKLQGKNDLAEIAKQQMKEAISLS